MVRDFNRWRAAMPGVLAALVLAILWLCVPHDRVTLAGWSMLGVVVATVAGVVGAAFVPGRFWLMLGVLAGLGGGTTLVVVGSAAGWGEAFRASLVLVTWTAFWACAAKALRRWGAVAGSVLPMGVAALCMALPVAAMPVVRWAAHWGASGTTSPWQGRVIAAIAHVCPFFGTLAALEPGARFDWRTIPLMYEWSGLGHEYPMALPSILVSSGIYAVGAFALWAVDGWLNGARRTPRMPGIAMPG